jgi:hypothetical protein
MHDWHNVNLTAMWELQGRKITIAKRHFDALIRASGWKHPQNMV